MSNGLVLARSLQRVSTQVDSDAARGSGSTNVSRSGCHAQQDTSHIRPDAAQSRAAEISSNEVMAGDGEASEEGGDQRADSEAHVTRNRESVQRSIDQVRLGNHLPP